MNTEYAHTITKEEVEELPMEKFEGRIFVLTNEKDANRAVAPWCNSRQKILVSSSG